MKSWQNLFANGLNLVSSQSMRTYLGIAIFFVVVIVIWVGASARRTHQVELFDSRELSPDEISLMQVAFGKAGLNDYEIESANISIPRRRRPDYLKALAEHDAIPRDLENKTASSAFDIFLPKSQQRELQLENKRKRISQMVAQLSFVHKALIDYDETSSATPFGDFQRTAVVSVKPTGLRGLQPHEIKTIRDTVCGAVAGLNGSDVTITDTVANRSYSGIDMALPNAMPPTAQIKTIQENEYENKIRKALTAYHGIRVNVEVSIDPMLRHRMEQRHVEGEPFVYAKTTHRETETRLPRSNSRSDVDWMGVGSNGQARIENWRTESGVDRILETTESLASGKFESTELAGLTVKNVSVSIGVSERCVVRFATRNAVSQATDTRSPAGQSARLDDQQLASSFETIRQDIQNKIQILLPRTMSAEDQIVVTMDPDIPLEINSQPTNVIAGSSNWFSQHWRTLALIIFGLAAVFILRGRGVAKDELEQSPVTLNTATAHHVAQASFDQGQLGPATDHHLPTGDPFNPGANNQQQTEILSQIDQWCRDNPDAAAATIRQWMNQAS